MIRGIHGLLYSNDPDATRAFFRDTMRLPGCDIGGGWWIFDFVEGDLGVHPAEDPDDVGLHDVSFFCDDIEGTVKELRTRGVVFTAPVADHGYGLVTYFEAPGGITVQLYEPRYVKRRAAPKSKGQRSKSRARTSAPKRAKKRPAVRATKKKR